MERGAPSGDPLMWRAVGEGGQEEIGQISLGQEALSSLALLGINCN